MKEINEKTLAETVFKVINKANSKTDFYMRCKTRSLSGYVWHKWEKVKLSEYEPDVLEITKADDYEGRPTVNIRVYGKLEEIFQR